MDTDFVGYLDGVEIARGQFGDSAVSKTWDRFSIAPIPAENHVLAILAFYTGEDFSDYEAGAAGLLACLKADQLEVFTDGQWRVSEHPALRIPPPTSSQWTLKPIAVATILICHCRFDERCC